MNNKRCSLCNKSEESARGIVRCGLDHKPGYQKNPNFDCPIWELNFKKWEPLAKKTKAVVK